jgi:hypothetical protein
MRLLKFCRITTKIATQSLATFLAFTFIFACLSALPVGASGVFEGLSNTQLVALQAIPENINTRNSNSFVTEAVNKVGLAVVRIDTERLVTRPNNRFLKIHFLTVFSMKIQGFNHLQKNY